jgi:hypothetical protein
MKYTKQLWKPSNFQAYSVIRGKYRNLQRALLVPCQLGFEGLCVAMSPATLSVDLFRRLRVRYLFNLHFKKMYKPYVLQRWKV